MTRYPFGYTLAGMTGVCIAVYAALFIIPEYVGGLVLVIGLGCGVVWIVGKVRRAFTYATHDLADFVRGKDNPGMARGSDGRFCNPKKSAMTAQLAAENAARKTKLSA